MACPVKGLLCLKKKGRDLLTLHPRHWRALHGTLSGTPVWGVPESAVREVKSASFGMDSSRIYANCVFVKGYLVIVFFPNAGSLSEAARVGKTEFFGERHLTKGQIQNRGWVGCD